MSAQSILHAPLPSRPGDRRRWGQLYGSAGSLVIAGAMQSHRAPMVVVTPDMHTAVQLEADLRFFGGDNLTCPIFIFPDWETLPYDRLSPHHDILSDRLLALSQLPTLERSILIVPVTTLMQRLPPRYFIDAHGLILQRGDRLNLGEFRRRLGGAGYYNVSQVITHGEFAVRGSLIDCYPMGADQPYRIDLFDDVIDSIRCFDPETQRSGETLERIELLPGHEFPMDEAAVTRFRQAWRERFPGNPVECPIYTDISQGISPAGIEYYLPLFFEETATLFDYMPQDTVFVSIGEITAHVDGFWQEIQARYEQYRHDITRPLVPPADLFLPANELFGAIKGMPRIGVQAPPQPDVAGTINFTTQPPPTLTVDYRATQPLSSVKHFLDTTTSRVLFCVESAGRREVLLKLLAEIDIHPASFSDWSAFLGTEEPIGLCVGSLEQGLSLIEPHVTLITETQLFGQQTPQRRRHKAREIDQDAIIRDLTELGIGAPVVHIDNGVGRYLGLERIQTNGHDAEYLTIAYANEDKLYVPVSSLHLIGRYTGADPEHAPLHRLGSKQWEREKHRTAKQVRDVAAQLLELYAKRQANPGLAFPKPDIGYQQFTADFPFEETPDQQRAIEEMIQDMTAPPPPWID